MTCWLHQFALPYPLQRIAGLSAVHRLRRVLHGQLSLGCCVRDADGERVQTTARSAVGRDLRFEGIHVQAGSVEAGPGGEAWRVSDYDYHARCQASIHAILLLRPVLAFLIRHDRAGEAYGQYLRKNGLRRLRAVLLSHCV